MAQIVLVVEDNESIASLERRYLEKDGFSVLTASNGAEGIGHVGSHDVDLLVIDYHLPDMSGVELMEKLKSMGKNIPAIIVTGSGNENIAVKSMKLGALDYIVKGKETIKNLAPTCKEALRRFNAEEENRRLFGELQSLNTELVEANRKLDDLSKIDDLTGIYNRRYLMDSLSYELWRCMRYRCPLSFAIFDIDHFKNVNDTYGHLTGDLVLRQFASLLRAELRKTDVLGRYGGEEFGVILVGTPIAKGIMSADRVRESVSKANFGPKQTPIQMTVSAGVSCLTEGLTIEALLDEADKSLYEAKRTGRNRVVSFQEGVQSPLCCIDECISDSSEGEKDGQGGSD